jgi:hypothetical protein
MQLLQSAAMLLIIFNLLGCGGQPQQPRTSSAPLTVDSVMRDYRAQQQQGKLETPPFDRIKWDALAEGMSPSDVANLLGKAGGKQMVNGTTGRVVQTGMIMTAITSPLPRTWTRPPGKNETTWVYAYDGGRTLRFVIFDEIVIEADTNGKLMDWSERKK